MRSRTLARFAVVAVAAMGAACSDTATTEPRDAGEISLDNWIGKVDTQCEKLSNGAQGLEAPKDIPDPRTPEASDLPALADYFDEIADVTEEGIRAIDDLPPPDEKQDQANEFVDSLGKYREQVLDSAKAARDGDLEGYKAAVDALVATSVQSNQDAKELGVTKCGEGA